jgi:hypothetical protein
MEMHPMSRHAPRQAFPLVASLALAVAACAEPAQPTAAAPVSDDRPSLIVNGTPTGSSYGSVGALLYDFDGNGKINGDDALCTGSLISPTVFLTAAHCVEFFPAKAQLWVSFDDELYPAPKRVIKATGFVYDKRYNHDFAHMYDLAVVFLPESGTKGVAPLDLPPAGYLDALAAKGSLAKTMFVNVGYGTSASKRGIPLFGYDGVRKFSLSEFMSLQPTWLGLLMNSSATGEGGDCYGDSGGPKFIDGKPNMVVATVTTGDTPCRATSWDWRLDIPASRDFLGQYVALP